MENDSRQPGQCSSPQLTAGLVKRVHEILKRAEQAGFGARVAASSEADKALMDDMWGED